MAMTNTKSSNPVRRWLSALAATLCILSANLHGSDVLLRYDMTQALPVTEDATNKLDGRALQVGAGAGTFNLPAALAYSTTPACTVAPASGVLPLANAAAALAADCAVFFDFQVACGAARVDLESLAFDIARGGSSTNRGFGVYVTTPAAADVLVKSSALIAAQRYTWDHQTVSLSGVAGLQGLKPGDVVRVKIPFWTTNAAQVLDLDNITLVGTAYPPTNAPAFAPLMITSARRQGDHMSLTWTSNPNRRYVMEFSPDLAAWGQFPTNIPASTGTTTSVTLDTAFTNLGSDVVLLQYQMGQAGPQLQGTAKSVIGGDLTPGSGLNSFNLTFSEYASAPSLLVNFLTAGTTLSAALANDNLFKVDVTVGTNVGSLKLTTLAFNVARGGSSTPRGYGVLVTTPTTTNQSVQGATTVDTVRPVWNPQAVNLSGVASLQNLKAGQRVTFTIPTYSPATGNSLEFDDLTLRGTITPPMLPRDGNGEKLFLRVREVETDPIQVEAAATPTSTWRFYSTRTLDQLPSGVQLQDDGPLSEFGGWLTLRTNATGFFYPLKAGGRWWLVDPQGYFFIHRGVAAVATINSTGATAALTATFGNSANWAVSATSLLREQRFNGAGAWSDTTRLKTVPGPLVRTIIGSFLDTYSATNTNPGYPQVFDATFEPFCQSYAKRFASTKTETSLLGYFSDNELPFPSTLLTDWLALTPGNASCDEAWRWLRARYGSAASTNNVTSQDKLDFLGNVWARYYRLVNQAIKQQDPNHLYLGSRLYSSDKDRPEVFRAIGPYVDVISVNHYSQWTPNIERIRMWEKESGRPVLITEFYVKGVDSGMTNSTGAGWLVRMQKDRGAFYHNFVLTLIESQACVGWHWFKYTDNYPDSNTDPSNIDSNKGVVGNRYVPYTVLLESMREINERAYRLTRYFDEFAEP